MANRIVSVHAGIYGMGIYAIMLPSSGFSVAHWHNTFVYNLILPHIVCEFFIVLCDIFPFNFPF